jgi:carnitine 3-dehydrogenase
MQALTKRLTKVPDSKVGIVGCGLIGASWAALFQAHGYRITAWDPSQQVLQDFSQRVSHIRASVRDLELCEMLQEPRITVASSLEELTRACNFIQESAPETLDMKRQLFTQIASASNPGTIVASSTSSLTWPELFEGISGNVKWLTAHPFNPPHIIPLVEIYGNDHQSVAEAVEIYRSLGKYPVVLKKPAVGHIANRLASALWREAVDIVAKGIADPEDVDAALVQGPGLRWAIMGAHMVYHLGGGPGGIRDYLQHLGPSQVRRWSSLGQSDLTPELCDLISEGVERETSSMNVAELEALRDKSLAAVLKSRRTIPG